MRLFAIAIPLFLTGDCALGQALSTTAAGLGIRNINFVEEGSQETEDDFFTTKVEPKIETITDPIICQRVSTASSLGLELGAGGCVQGGGFRTFAHSISAHLQMIYYPLASRTQIENDASVRLRRQFLGDFYLIGYGGFAKITHAQNQETTRSLSMDILEVGGGLGWTYRLFNNVAFGIEGNYLVGSILSTAATGSTNMMMGTALVTVFL